MELKREVISSMFPEKLYFENNSLRTRRVNEIVKHIYMINESRLNKIIAQKKPNIAVRLFVGVAGFEPAASCSQSRRDNRATLHPEFIFCKIRF
jgi:site-specific DNA recombinase